MGASTSKDVSWHAREGYKPTAAWLRMRERYRPRNIASGAAVVAFIAGVYVYTIKAVDQDTFEDVPMPPPPSLPSEYPGVAHKALDPSMEGVKRKM